MRRVAQASARAARAAGALPPAPQLRGGAQAFISLPSLGGADKTFQKRKTVPYSPQQARRTHAHAARHDRAAHRAPPRADLRRGGGH
jgi:hypothetical protein